MENYNDDTLTTDEKMLIYMIRTYELPIETIFTSIYKTYDIENRDVANAE
tara:strand:- start:296 stop:445 length:150 start_codon:yes stop_codon:yes gene_type:complete